MITALYILVAANLCILLAGQFVQVAPFIMLSAVMLWVELFRINRLALLKTWQFWTWFVVLAVMLAQCLNAGNVKEINRTLEFNLPSKLWLPFTVNRNVSVMAFITWFSIAGQTIASKHVDVNLRVRFILTLSVILAVLGIAQFYCKANGFMWLIPYDKTFFSIFPYVNNAGTFFMLAGGIALWKGWRYFPVFALCLWSIWLCEARFSIGCMAVIFTAKLTGRLGKYIIPAIIICALAIYIDEIMSTRWHEYELNLHIIRNCPVYGVGAEGNTSFIYLYAKPWMVELLAKHPNCHCDPLIFCSEYGVFICLAGAISLLKCLGNGRILGMGLELNLALLSAVLALFHSCIDMPFHCPAVVVIWIISCECACYSENETDLYLKNRQEN